MNANQTFRRQRTWMLLAMVNFALAASLGALLRWAFIEEVPGLVFKNVLHAHSHVAMLGWLYLGLFALLVAAFVPETVVRASRLGLLFALGEIGVLGMLVSFPVQGYGAVSIAFSTLHMLAAYGFAVVVWREIRGQSGIAYRWIQAALGWMVLSTLGVWAMGPIMALGMQNTLWYYMSVQFYLHFQFNGWFLFAALALWFRYWELAGIEFSAPANRRLLYVLSVATVLTFALALAWGTHSPWVLAANSVGVLVQFVALFLLLALLKPHQASIKQSLAGSAWSYGLFAIGLGALVLKMTIQSAVAIPAIAEIAYTIRLYVIGFIHLILLGMLSAWLFSLFAAAGVLYLNRITRLGLVLVLGGIAISELLLFLQGTLFWARVGFLPNFYEWLFAGSVWMPVGIVIMLLGQVFPQPRGGTPPAAQ